MEGLVVFCCDCVDEEVNSTEFNRREKQMRLDGSDTVHDDEVD